MSAVVEIEQYRLEHSFTDHRMAIGPQPALHDVAHAWSHVSEVICDVRDLIVSRRQVNLPETAVAVRPLQDRLDGPVPDLGL